MAILDQAKKAIRRDERRTVVNLRRRRDMKAAVKEVIELVAAGKTKEAAEKVPGAYKAIDKALKNAVIKPNTAARKKARLARITKADK